MNDSPIQWTDDTVNPVMGCEGCELWPTVAQVQAKLISLILRFLSNDRKEIRNRVRPYLNRYETVTELWHDRRRLINALRKEFPTVSEYQLHECIEEALRCYAGLIHLIRGGRPPEYDRSKVLGNAIIFDRPTKFPGRVAEAARLSDLRGTERSKKGYNKPWLDELPRLIFISDMGDALSEAIDFDYLKDEIIDAVSSPAGLRHRWLWLTKRPARMADFATWLFTSHGIEWPKNLVAMTSVTNRATRSRIDQLRKVPAMFRGLSVEPLVESVELDLTGIDWVIVGGESGKYARDFDIDWARSIREQCRDAGVAFFVKQLGANAVESGFPIPLANSHGGNWDEWPLDLRIREMPLGLTEPISISIPS